MSAMVAGSYLVGAVARYGYWLSFPMTCRWQSVAPAGTSNLTAVDGIGTACASVARQARAAAATAGPRRRMSRRVSITALPGRLGDAARTVSWGCETLS